MQKLIDTIKLMAKTGLFFANADGDYSDKEKQFITDFVLGIEKIGDLETELKAQVLDAVNHTYTFDEIVDETSSLLEGFCPEEQDAIKKSLEAFVRQVITIDGKCRQEEHEFYIRWRQAI